MVMVESQEPTWQLSDLSRARLETHKLLCLPYAAGQVSHISRPKVRVCENLQITWQRSWIDGEYTLEANNFNLSQPNNQPDG